MGAAACTVTIYDERTAPGRYLVTHFTMQPAGTTREPLPPDHTLPVYDTASIGPAWWTEAVELWRYRDLVAQFAARDIKVRYKRSVLGVAWTLLSPLLMMVVYTLAFRHVFQVESPSYPVFLLSGVLPWTFFAQVTTSAMHQLLGGGSLLSRIYMPRTAFAVSSIIVGLVNLLLSLVPLFGLMFVTGVPFTGALFWLPVAIILMAVFALGFALIISSLVVRFHDVAEIYQVVLQAWFFWTPILYPPTLIPGDQAWRVMTNPMAPLIGLFREPILDGRSPDGLTLLVTALVAFGTLIIGWVLFTSRSDELAYRL